MFDKIQAVSETLDPITRNQIRHAADELHEEFAGVFSTETIARYIEESTDLLRGARISTYIPLSSTGLRANGCRRSRNRRATS